MFKNMRIGVRLGLLVGFMILLLIFIGVLGLRGMRQTDEGLESTFANTQTSNQLANISDLMWEINRQLLLSQFHDPKLEVSKVHEADHPITKHTDKAEENVLKIEEALKKYLASNMAPEEKKLAEKFSEDWRKLVNEGIRPSLSYLKDRKFLDANLHTVKVLTPLFNQAEKNIGDSVDVLEKLSEKERELSDRGYENSRNIVVGSLIGGIVIALLVSLWIIRSVTRPLIEGVNVMDRLADGDLTTDVKAESTDETGRLLAAMKKMVERLRSVVVDVKVVADNVASGSQELSSSAQELSQGATEQASSVEEVSSSMQEISANIQQNAENAQQTEKISVKAADDARESGKAVTESVSAMKEIASRISIIEEIARQTNLLALNAAIEAARAGEHGKGFAVVASEVRKLAERSQTAAGEISKLSASSVAVAEKAGEMLAKLVPDIQKTAELVQEISASSREQNAGTQQINQTIQQLDQVVQQNAGASEELASTAEELTSQSEALINTMAYFKVDERGGASVKKVKAAGPAHKVRVAHLGREAEKGAKPARELTPKAEEKKRGVDPDLGEEPKEGEGEFERY